MPSHAMSIINLKKGGSPEPPESPPAYALECEEEMQNSKGYAESPEFLPALGLEEVRRGILDP